MLLVGELRVCGPEASVLCESDASVSTLRPVDAVVSTAMVHVAGAATGLPMRSRKRDVSRRR